MKSKVMTRPNLRLLVAAAGLLLVVVQLSMPGNPQTVMVAQARTDPQLTEAALQALLRNVSIRPDPDLYLQISRLYEQRGELRKAAQYLKRAELLSQANHE